MDRKSEFGDRSGCVHESIPPKEAKRQERKLPLQENGEWGRMIYDQSM